MLLLHASSVILGHLSGLFGCIGGILAHLGPFGGTVGKSCGHLGVLRGALVGAVLEAMCPLEVPRQWLDRH